MKKIILTLMFFVLIMLAHAGGTNDPVATFFALTSDELDIQMMSWNIDRFRNIQNTASNTIVTLNLNHASIFEVADTLNKLVPQNTTNQYRITIDTRLQRRAIWSVSTQLSNAPLVAVYAILDQLGAVTLYDARLDCLVLADSDFLPTSPATEEQRYERYLSRTWQLNFNPSQEEYRHLVETFGVRPQHEDEE